MIGAKPLGIRFNKVDGFIRVYDGTSPEKYDVISNRIRYLISLKCGITYVISHYYAKIKNELSDSLPLEKKVTLHDVVIFIKSVI